MSLRLFLTGIFALVPLCLAHADEPAKKDARPKVEVVFCLDTTSSMSGLIDAAKKKIWSISNQIASGNPTPDLRIGLVAFRDRGDAYITKVVDLTDDLDGIHTQLMELKADGGGDEPESVNQALHEAVTKITWSKEKKTLKMIFLVGDAPPHMDYPDDVKYPDTCKQAVKNDIIINTVQCGTSASCQKYWKEICQLAEGKYVQIDQGGGPVVAIATPFDADLARVNSEISAKTLVFGTERDQKSAEEKKARNAELPTAAAADRAGYYSGTGGAVAYDLLTNIKNGTVKLEELKKEQLPPELRGLKLDEQKKYLENVDKCRQDLTAKAQDWNLKRNAFIQKKQQEDAAKAGKDSFDQQVLQILQTQATRNNIQYGNVEKKQP